MTDLKPPTSPSFVSITRRHWRLLCTLAVAASLLTATPAGSATMCGGLVVTIEGTAGDDVINGTAGIDIIHGLAGDDVIQGRQGEDIICGGDGKDEIRGGSGNDTIFGQNGADQIDGRSGSDTIDGGPGADRLLGDQGKDTIDGGPGRDVIKGGKGDDVLTGSSGKDTIYGQNGDDVIRGGSGQDGLSGGSHDDSLFGDDGSDVLNGGTGADKGTGGNHWDDCYSAARQDSCEGPIFFAGFDANPTQPTAVKSSEKMTISTNSRVGSTRDELASMQADHGSDCAGPPSKHIVKEYEDAQFNCRFHMMTAISAGPDKLDNYAVSMFSPNAILDFSAGEAVIQFDVSTLRRSKRDWFEIWITPWSHLQRIPVQDHPSMQGPPRNGLVVALKSFTDRGSFDVRVQKNFKTTDIDGPVEWIGYETFLDPSPTVRSKFEIRISKDHITVGMPDEPFYWISEDVPGGVGFDKGIVQFGHNSYDVFDCEGCSVGPNTWHWDNIYMAPAEPITALPANRRHVDDSSASFVTFDKPAPANAKVQFTGIGFDLQASFDNGATWSDVETVHNKNVFHWRYKNYSMPIPDGTTRVDFRGNNPYDGHWQIQDISILARALPPETVNLGSSMAYLGLDVGPMPEAG